jgi:excinuclease UvrABC nuclease subunit
MKASELDGIKGLGPKRREKLLAALGDINAVKEASLERLNDLLPPDVAQAVHDRFTPRH